MKIYEVTSSEISDKIVIAESITEASKKFIDKENEHQRYESDKVDESCIDKIERLFSEFDVII
jgi:peptide methionine sulfoxide reductase MsrA